MPNTPIPAATKDASLAAMVPTKLTSAGKAVVATDASYAPNEFFASDNTTIIGMDIDLGHAIGQVLGVPFDFQNASFDSIIPAMGTRYDVSMSSFTDTLERQQKVDMVTYFSAGTSFYVTKGENSDLSSLDALCGKSVGVEKGTTQATDATGQSAKCTKAGKSEGRRAAVPGPERGQRGPGQWPGRPWSWPTRRWPPTRSSSRAASSPWPASPTAPPRTASWCPRPLTTPGSATPSWVPSRCSTATASTPRSWPSGACSRGPSATSQLNGATS